MRPDDGNPGRVDLSFLAPPGEVCDWRTVLLFDTACEVGLDEALSGGPGSPGDLASRLGLDGHAVRVLLESLAAWSVVVRDDDGCFHPARAGPTGPRPPPCAITPGPFVGPEVLEVVGDRLRAAGIELVAGDFFETLPAGPFDLVFCAGVNHTYDEGRNRELCHRAAEVTNPGGALAIVTYLRDRDPMAPVFAVQMLAGGRGGDTHSEEDFRRWLGEAGYGSVELVERAHPRETLLLARR